MLWVAKKIKLFTKYSKKLNCAIECLVDFAIFCQFQYFTIFENAPKNIYIKKT